MKTQTYTRSLIACIHDNIDTSCRFDGAEIGVWKGHNAAALLEEFSHLHLCMIDSYRSGYLGMGRVGKPELSQADFEEAKQSAADRTQIYQHRSSRLFVSSNEASRTVNKKYSFVFLDASHSQDEENDVGIATDIRLWRECVLPGGILCGHDYNGLSDRRGLFCVKKSVDAAFGDRVNAKPGLIWWVKL